ncbi:hypothetical protein MTR67_026902 [Solanum verrucosum]|uniref:Reverse transcriptase zinc-binding domain-containing protein n=1 Tax=Solanum verrucosum TaxID=315347 RepID=A0AAF0TUE3_SOLVR|nr:hypothetical protein MTR67_026902 [Solanum verrucosum]
MFDISKAMYAKLWWRFRTQNTLWANFMWNKYCKKHIPTLVQWKDGSQLWKNMLQNRDDIEKFIWWEPKGGTSTVWQHMDHIRQTDMGDKPWWIKTSTRKFSVKSAWEILRKKKEVNENCKMIWVQDLPFKISFFSWRVWTNRVPVAVVIAHWNPNQSQLCLCCSVPAKETMQHLFLKGEIANKVWQYFSSAAGILGPWIQLKQSIKKWWDVQGNTRQKMVALLDVFRHRFVSKWVKWHPPPSGWLKCNTDGASRGNPGPSAAAFCIKNHEGELVTAKGVRILDSTNLVAEVLLLEKGEWEIPWNVTMKVNSINRLRNSMSVRVQHSLREENTLADFFANLVFLFAALAQASSRRPPPAALLPPPSPRRPPPAALLFSSLLSFPPVSSHQRDKSAYLSSLQSTSTAGEESNISGQLTPTSIHCPFPLIEG